MTVKDFLFIIALAGLLVQGIALHSTDNTADALLAEIHQCDAPNSKLMDAQ